MTNYTMKKLLRCLLRDTDNVNDIMEAIREALRNTYNYSDITDDAYDGECYTATGYDSDYTIYNICIPISEIAILLNEGK